MQTVRGAGSFASRALTTARAAGRCRRRGGGPVAPPSACTAAPAGTSCRRQGAGHTQPGREAGQRRRACTWASHRECLVQHAHSTACGLAKKTAGHSPAAEAVLSKPESKLCSPKAWCAEQWPVNLNRSTPAGHATSPLQPRLWVRQQSHQAGQAVLLPQHEQGGRVAAHHAAAQQQGAGGRWKGAQEW